MPPSTTPSAPAGAGKVVLRVLAIVLGGYMATAALVAAATSVLPLLGIARGDAVTVSGMAGFLVYLGFILWAAAEPRLGRVVGWLVAITTAGTAIAGLFSFGGL